MSEQSKKPPFKEKKEGLVGPSILKGGTFREVASKKIVFESIEKYMNKA